MTCPFVDNSDYIFIIRCFGKRGVTIGIRAGRSVRPISRVVSNLVVLCDSFKLSFVVLIVVCCVENWLEYNHVRINCFSKSVSFLLLKKKAEQSFWLLSS